MNRVALVTGSSRGLGREIAIALAKEGYDIAVNFSRNRKKAEEVQQEIEQLGRKCVIFKANVGTWKKLETYLKL